MTNEGIEAWIAAILRDPSSGCRTAEEAGRKVVSYGGDAGTVSSVVMAMTAGARESWYDNATRSYWTRNARGVYAPLSEGQLKRHLKAAGIRVKPAEGEAMSEADKELLRLQHTCDVDYAGPLAGYDRGLYSEPDGRRVLVTEGPDVPVPVDGDWPTIRSVVLGLLADDRYQQSDVFISWLAIAYKTLRARMRLPGHALVLAGPAGIGKSLLQSIITEVLGGRSAKPYQYMAGMTPFNAHLFGAEHLVVEDEASSGETRSRRSFGAAIKGVTVCETQSCHAKGRTPLMLRPFWRLSISVNDEPEDMMVLPPMDSALEDKIIMLRCTHPARPPDTQTAEGRAAFWGAIKSEVPALCATLAAWTVPDHLTAARFGLTAWKHPDLLEALGALSPEENLLRLVDDEILLSAGEWGGSATDLENRLTSSDSACSHAARRVLTWPSACGVYLARLARRYPSRVRLSRRHGGAKLWTITADSAVTE